MTTPTFAFHCLYDNAKVGVAPSELQPSHELVRHNKRGQHQLRLDVVAHSHRHTRHPAVHETRPFAQPLHSQHLLVLNTQRAPFTYITGVHSIARNIKQLERASSF